MHQQNDVVVFIENGVAANALVVSSSQLPDIHPGHNLAPDEKPPLVEHLSLILIPEKTQGVQNLTPIAHGSFLRVVYGIRPATDEKSVGWKELATVQDEKIAELNKGIAEITARAADNEAELVEKINVVTKELNDQQSSNATLADQVKQLSDENAALKEEIGKPSAADLDAVSAEQKAAEATATQLLEHGTDQEAHEQAEKAEAHAGEA